MSTKHYLIIPFMLFLVGAFLWMNLPHRLIYAATVWFGGGGFVFWLIHLYDKYLFKPKQCKRQEYVPYKHPGKYRAKFNDFCSIMFSLSVMVIWYGGWAFFWHWVCTGRLW